MQSFYSTTAAGNIGKFNNIEDMIATGNYKAANSLNNSIKPTLALEQNQQTVNGLVLRRLLNVNYVYTAADKNTLNAIANQCPISGGNSVYQARVLLMTIANNVIEFIDDCSGTKATRSMEEAPIAEEAPVETKLFKLYPNPNKGNMVLDYTLNVNEKGLIEIYDLSGKLIVNYEFSNAHDQITINNEQLNNGIYFYQVKINNQIVQSDKLVIIK